MVTDELKDLQIRLITKEETNLWGQYMEKYHYLGYRWIPGESLRYVVLLDGIWVAIIGWGSPTLKCTVRDRYIGWDNDTKYKRLSFVANNVRFLIFPWVHIKNLYNNNRPKGVYVYPLSKAGKGHVNNTVFTCRGTYYGRQNNP